MSLMFADTHNMVAYLHKSDASEGFNKVIDFLNGSYIKYALTVNPNIYVSCIKQFWNTVVVNQSNDVTRLQALVDRKRVVITKAAIREVLYLDYAEGVDCLPNEEILLNWLAWLKRRVKKLEKGNRVKALKLRRLHKVGTSQRIDTSDDTVMEDVSNQGRMIDDLDKDDALDLMEDDPAEVREVMDVVTTPKLITEVVTAASESVTAASTTISAAEPHVPAATITTSALVRVAVASTRRRKGVVNRDPKEESTTIIPADTKSKDNGKGIMVEKPKPLKKKQQVEMDEVYARKLHENINKDIDWNVAIEHVKKKAKEDPFVQRYQVIKKRPQTEAQARKNMIMYLKNVAGFRLDYFKGMSYDDIHPIFKAKFNSNIEFLLKTKRQLEEEENRAI
nr:xylulose kinase-1 [Tanacetum cinerariifolium]GEZ88703.1 xylulose kinase-1 [Tanacetum cinerariifolium]